MKNNKIAQIQTNLTRQPAAYQISFQIRQLQDFFEDATVRLRLLNLNNIGYVHSEDDLGRHLTNLVAHFGLDEVNQTAKLFKKGA